MSIGGVILGSVRGVMIAAATGAAAFGLLVVFHPFAAPTATQSPAISAPAGSDALKQKIDAARDALRQSEAALDNVTGRSLAVTTSPGDSDIAAQLAAAIDRRDLALRHAKAIRDALAAGADLSALAEIRDSVLIGQLLGQQVALETQIAEQGARLKPNHPTMRALNAQRVALLVQIESEAKGIVAALESEAKLDDAQIKLLQGGARTAASSAPADTASLEAEAMAQRTELDGLMDTYLNLGPGTATAGTAAAPMTSADLNPLNLFVAGVAVIAAIVFQIGLALRWRRLRQNEARDLAAWQRDHDPDLPFAEPAAVQAAPPLRRAS